MLGVIDVPLDSTRQKILDTGIISHVIDELSGTQNNDLRKVRTGFLLNVSLGFCKCSLSPLSHSSSAPVRNTFNSQECFQAVLSSVSTQLLEAKEFATVYLCLELLSNLLEEGTNEFSDTSADSPESCTKLFPQNYSNVQALIKPLDYYKLNRGEFDVPILTHLVESIEGFLNDNGKFAINCC